MHVETFQYCRHQTLEGKLLSALPHRLWNFLYLYSLYIFFQWNFRIFTKKSSILYISTIGCVQKTISSPPPVSPGVGHSVPRKCPTGAPRSCPGAPSVGRNFRTKLDKLVDDYQLPRYFRQKTPGEKWMSIGIGRFFQSGKMILMKHSKCQASNGIHAISHDVRMPSQLKDFLNLKGCELRYNEIIFIRCRISSINSSIVGSLRLDI